MKVVNNMYFIDILDITTNKEWREEFDSYYLFRKRYYRLKYSRKLIILAHSKVGEK